MPGEQDRQKGRGMQHHCRPRVEDVGEGNVEEVAAVIAAQEYAKGERDVECVDGQKTHLGSKSHSFLNVFFQKAGLFYNRKSFCFVRKTVQLYGHIAVMIITKSL